MTGRTSDPSGASDPSDTEHLRVHQFIRRHGRRPSPHERRPDGTASDAAPRVAALARTRLLLGRALVRL